MANVRLDLLPHQPLQGKRPSLSEEERKRISYVLWAESANDPGGWIAKLNTYSKAGRSNESLADTTERVSSAFRTKSPQYKLIKEGRLNPYELGIEQKLLSAIGDFIPDPNWKYIHHENPAFYQDIPTMNKRLQKAWGDDIDFDNPLKVGKEFYFKKKMKAVPKDKKSIGKTISDFLIPPVEPAELGYDLSVLPNQPKIPDYNLSTLPHQPSSPDNLDLSLLPHQPGPGIFARGKKIITESAKATLRGIEGSFASIGDVIRWAGESIGREAEKAGEKAKEDPGRFAGVDLRVLEAGNKFQEEMGNKISRWGVDTARFWHREMKVGIEVGDPEIFSGSFMENPSWTRGIAIVAGAIPSLATATSISFMTGNPFSGALSLGLLEGSGTYVEARQAGKGVDYAGTLGLLSVSGNALLEVIPITRFLRGGKGKLVKDIFVGAGEEAIQEGAQAAWMNLIAKVGYDKTRDLTEGMVEGFIAGAGSGGVLGGLTSGRSRRVDEITREAHQKGVLPEEMEVMQEEVKDEIITKSKEIDKTLDDEATRIAKIAKKINVDEDAAIGKASEARKIIEAAGGKIVGIQKGFEDIPDQILFNDPHDSTLPLPITEVTKENVIARIEESRKKYEQVQEKDLGQRLREEQDKAIQLLRKIRKLREEKAKGKPKFEEEVYQGKGKAKEKVYTAAQIPIAGEGEYFAFNEAEAKTFGEVTKKKVSLNNPLEINTDDQWKALTKEAGWRYPNLFALSEAEVAKNTADLKKIILSKGYDGLIIRISEAGDEGKTLRNVFGIDQVVVYKPPVLPSPAPPSPAAGKFFIRKTIDALGKGEKEIEITKKDKFVEVKGKSIKAPGFEGLDLFIHGSTKEGWVVSEGSTGLQISTGRTKAMALSEAQTRLEEHKDKIDSLIKEAQKKAISPRVKKPVIIKPRPEPVSEEQALEAKKMDVNLPKEPETAEKIHKTRIVTWAEKAFGVPIKGRATHRFKALGMYYNKRELIRLQKWGDLEVLTHEIAHHIDKKVKQSLGKMWKKHIIPGGQRRATIKELADLDYKQGKSGRRTSEGFAEFIRHFLTTDQAPKRAPIFHKFFTENFLNENPKLKGNLDVLRKMMDTWQKQGSENRVLAQVDFKGEHTKVGGIADKIQRAKDWILKNFDSEFYFIAKVEGQMGIKPGVNIRPTEDPLTMAVYSKSKAGIVARTFIEDKAVDETGKEIGPGLTEILRPVSKSQMKTFIAYGISKRAINLADRNIESGIDIDDAKYIVEKYQSEAWDKVADDLTQWSNHLLDWVVRAGGLGPGEAAAIRKLNPVYLPFKRAFIDEVEVTKGIGGYVDRGTSVKKIRGSGRPILNPIEAMMAQATEMIAKAQKIRIAGLMADLAQREGVGGFITKVPAPMTAVKAPLGRVKGFLEILEDMGLLEEGAKVDLDLDKMLTVFTQDWQYRGKDNVVSIWRNGKREFYEMHKDLYRAISGVDPLVMPKVVRVLFSPFSRMLRLGATGLKVSFGLARNPWRDAFSYAAFSKRKSANVFDPLKGIYQEIISKPGDLISRFKRTGGALAGMMGHDRAAYMATYDEMLSTKLGKLGKVLKVAKHPIDSLRGLLSFTELAPRSIELQKSYEEAKKKHPDWTEEDWYVQAFNDAQDVTVNFTKSGFYAKRINEVAAFFNVAIRGPEKLYRSMRERPMQTLIKGIVYVTLPALALWWKDKDKQWYKNLPNTYKYNNFFFELKDGTVVRLPIPFDLGIVFASAPMAAMDTLYYKDPKYVTALMDGIIMQIPDPTPTMFKPWLDVKTNRNFLGIPIESPGLQYQFPTERRRAHTLPFAIGFSRALNALKIRPGGLNLSPIQVEYLLDAYTGGFLRQFPIKPVLEPADIPIMGDLVLRMPENPKRQTNEFFSEYEVLSQRKQSGIASVPQRKRLNQIKPLYSLLIRSLFPRLRRFQKAKDIESIKKTYELIQRQMERFGYK